MHETDIRIYSKLISWLRIKNFPICNFSPVCCWKKRFFSENLLCGNLISFSFMRQCKKNFILFRQTSEKLSIKFQKPFNYTHNSIFPVKTTDWLQKLRTWMEIFHPFFNLKRRSFDVALIGRFMTAQLHFLRVSWLNLN